MLIQLFLILMGSTYLVLFGGHWLCLTLRPISVSTRPLTFIHCCYLSLGTCYIGVGCFGA
jgi:hypothetical protein